MGVLLEDGRAWVGNLVWVGKDAASAAPHQRRYDVEVELGSSRLMATRDEITVLGDEADAADWLLRHAEGGAR